MKIILSFSIIVFNLNVLLAQRNSMIVSKYEKVIENIDGNVNYYDISTGYCPEKKDTLVTISLGTRDSLYAGLVGDSIRFEIKPLTEKGKMNLGKYVKQRNFLYVFITSVCKDYILNSCYLPSKNNLVMCSKRYCPIYYIDNKPIFSNDKKLNRKLKRQYNSRNKN